MQDLQNLTHGHKKHLTATGYILNESKTKMLLIWHKGLLKWLPAGGHVDENESPDIAALREIEEETGLKETVKLIDNSKDLGLKGLVDTQIVAPVAMMYQVIPESKKDIEHIHLDMVYMAIASEDESIIEKLDEIDKCKWVLKSVILADDFDAFDSVKGFARAYME